MQKFSLELLFHIIGIGSASGLVLKEESLFIISDNSGFLYEFHINKKELTRKQLFENAQENTPKKDKADFEAITLKNDQLHLFGSGSTPKRANRLIYDLKSNEISREDNTGLYENMKLCAGIPDEDFNIEGALYHKQQLLLFQRGNGAQSKNGIFIIEDSTHPKPAFHPFTLPKLQNNEAAFTDAILVNDKIYFLAAVENTTSTYDDGEVLGTFYGTINPKSLKLEQAVLLPGKNKFEGICFYKEDETTISFLLCEDNDTDKLQSNIYRLIINK